MRVVQSCTLESECLEKVHVGSLVIVKVFDMCTKFCVAGTECKSARRLTAEVHNSATDDAKADVENL